jgi:LPS export ABC transporter protein LptC
MLLGLGAWGLWGRRPPPPPPRPAPATTEAPARMESLALTEIQDGDKRWVLEALKADYHKERTEISISEVKVDFYGAAGEHILVKAKEGLLQTKTRILTLRGQVEMDRGDLHVTTNVAIYQPEGRLLLAPEDVVLETPRLRVTGKDLKVQLGEKKLFLAQHHLTEIKSVEWRTKQ